MLTSNVKWWQYSHYPSYQNILSQTKGWNTLKWSANSSGENYRLSLHKWDLKIDAMMPKTQEGQAMDTVGTWVLHWKNEESDIIQ